MAIYTAALGSLTASQVSDIRLIDKVLLLFCRLKKLGVGKCSHRKSLAEPNNET